MKFVHYCTEIAWVSFVFPQNLKKNYFFNFVISYIFVIYKLKSSLVKNTIYKNIIIGRAGSAQGGKTISKFRYSFVERSWFHRPGTLKHYLTQYTRGTPAIFCSMNNRPRYLTRFLLPFNGVIETNSPAWSRRVLRFVRRAGEIIVRLGDPFHTGRNKRQQPPRL